MKHTETADIETSSDAYATRFAGPLGTWLLSVQEGIILKFLSRYLVKTVLDVGGGHGQLAYPLANRGYAVHVFGSDPICAHRVQNLITEGRASFTSGDLLSLPLSDKSFDAVISIRLIPHCNDWPTLISELCRVSKGPVIIDYPPRRSFNIFYSFFFKMKLKAEGNTRPFAIFDDQEIADAFSRCGYKLRYKAPQFFLPMVIHRMLKSPTISGIIESFFRLTGLTYIFGSPTIACFEPT